MWAIRAKDVLGFRRGSKFQICGRFPSAHERPSQQKAACRSLMGREMCGKGFSFVALKEECGVEGLKRAVDQLGGVGSKVGCDTYASLLRCCGSAKALGDGRRVHAHIVAGGYGGDRFLGNLLVQMYGNCGCPNDARGVFDKIDERNLFSWNIMIQVYANNGLVEDAKCMFNQMPQRDVVSWNLLVNMFGKCGSLDEARSVFDKMPQRDVVSWNAMIAAYARNQHGKEALDLFRKMQLKGVEPNRVTFLGILDACVCLANLAEGKNSHASIIDSGFEQDVVVGTALVNMYGKCGSPDDARSAFDKLPQRNIFSWNAMIATYSRNGNGKEALHLFRQMQEKGVKPDKITFVSILDACAGLADLAEGKENHTSIIDNTFESDVVVGTALVNMYGKCRCLDDARSVFDKIYQRNVVSWNAMIAAYSQNGHGRDALELFGQMQLEGVQTNNITFIIILDACARLLAPVDGKVSHAMVIESGFETDLVVVNAVVNMYGKSGSLDDARSVFDRMPERNAVSWNTMITAYSQNGHAKESLKLFEQMQLKGMEPTRITFISILDACAGLPDLAKGKETHANIIGNGFELDGTLGTALINLYGKRGSLDDARSVFDKMPQHDTVLWNALIAAYSKNGHGMEALKVFQQMLCKGVAPGMITFISILDVCASLAAIAEGKEHHASIIDRGFESNVVVGTALVNMYGKCGILDDARSIFHKMPECNVVSWNAMIATYAQNGHGKEALEFFQQMQLKGVEPNKITFISILDACAGFAAIAKGRESHASIVESGHESDAFVGTMLVNMYGKCGNLEDARSVFDKLPQQVVVSWNAIIAAYSLNGCGKEALKLFQQMQLKGVEPNKITFINILCGCSHGGLLDDGWRCFISMSSDYAITPTIEHFVCMIDLLGRAGQLDEAEDLVSSMPFGPYAVAWVSLLGACKIYGDMERGAHAAEHIFELDPNNSASFVLLSNIYAAAGQWDDAAKVRKVMKDKCVKKKLGRSCIEIKKRVHEFIAGDMSHPQKEEIYMELHRLTRQMEDIGYMPDTEAAPRHVNKKRMVSHHSEKLAIAFGLISTLPETPLYVTKNLRVCSDCHAATKLISKIVQRKIIVRDAIRFHHFEHGVCSCGDYW